MVVVIASVLAAAAVAAVLWFTAGPGGQDDGEPSTAAPSASDSTDSTDGTDPSEDADPSASASAESSPSGSPEVPDGYEVVTDPAGFTLAVPDGWSRITQGSSVFYMSPDRRSLVQVFEVTESGYTPLKAVRDADESLALRATDYLQYDLGPVVSGPENPSGDAAELRYGYTSTGTGGQRQCIERAFTATDATLYAVLGCVPGEQSPAQRTLLDNALAHFTP
ncbi:hypothetical protein [Streptomyces qinzhouensis]|uniref:Serine/arginine repetitive matrix protein 2 n=1 Tax=Streptomyces qinzhouensis TaxID=2599401 RepID=A0A5B8IQ01_9ACTN|nr:hypothetical protein [Streptomyces qinzhouensis]QDY79679.1 hypothetical protein FQU76_27625 [Streptomyces qinzhouensis]